MLSKTKKVIKYILLVLFLIFTPIKTTHAQSNAKYKIKKITQISYDIKKGNPPIDIDAAFSDDIDHALNDYTINETLFDENQNITQKLQYKNNSNTSRKTIYIRNKKGVLEKTIVTNENDKIEESNIYKYNSVNKLITINTYNNKKHLIKNEVNEYNKKNLIIEKKYTNLIKKTVYKLTYKYGSNNLIAEKIGYRLDKKEKNKWIYSYDKKGKLIKEIQEKTANENILNKKTILYNKTNNIKTEISYIKKNNKTLKFQYNYIEYGLNNDWIWKCKYLDKSYTKIWFRKFEYFN